MKLGEIADDLGFDMRLDVVLARTEQLVRLESNAVIENKTIAHNLQRKVGIVTLRSTEKRNFGKPKCHNDFIILWSALCLEAEY